MIGAPPPGFMQNLDRKYGLMARDVATREMAARSNANLDMARAAGLAADAGLRTAQAEGLRNEIASDRADWFDPQGLRQARAALGFAQAGTQRAQTGLLQEQTALARRVREDSMPRDTRPAQGFELMSERPESDVLSPRPTRPRGLGLPYSLSLDLPELRFAKGTARVPGKGNGTKDTVKARLAPGEAVLNKPAADMAGRGMIAALNKLGARKMGMA